MDCKIQQTPEELVRLIRERLRGKYVRVPIRIERDDGGWIAVAQVGSEMTRERIEAAARRAREFNDLA